MPREIYNDGELVTDDLGRLWLISALNPRVGLLMPELPDFLSTQEEKHATVEGFEFDQMADGIAAAQERAAKIVEAAVPDLIERMAAREIAEKIRSRK